MLIFLVVASILLQPWPTHESIDGQFSIYAPGEFLKSVKDIETPVGTLQFHQLYFTSSDEELGRAHFNVSYCDYPKGSFPSDSLELISAFLDVTSEQSALAIKGELIYQDSIGIERYPGRFARIHFKDGASVLKSHSYLVEDRFYTIQVALTSTHAQEGFIDEYFDSFKLTH